MSIEVKEVREKDEIAVRVVLVSNETVGTALVMGKDGKPIEPPHSRFREDGKQIRTPDDLDIPRGDYNQMFFVAGGILDKKRRKRPN